MLDGIGNTHDIVHINHELHDRRSILFSSAHLACNVVGQGFECRTRHESPGQSAFRLDAYFTYMFRESSVLFYVVIVRGNITVPEKCITIRVHFATIHSVCTSRNIACKIHPNIVRNLPECSLEISIFAFEELNMINLRLYANT